MQPTAFVNTDRDRASWRAVARWLLLLLVLAAFARGVYRLDSRNLWLDEAFSLQRAEAGWPEVVAGGLKVADTPGAAAVTDPHPFGYYALLKPALALFGSSEFALRFSSAIATTLLVPATWALARLLARRTVVPGSTPAWVALLATASPFYLWYAQEARMYALVALLAVLSTFMLLRWLETAAPAGHPRWWLAGYVASIVLLLSAHFFSLLILPVHAGVAYLSLAPQSRRRAVLVAALILALALVPALAALWLVLSEPGAVGHFATASPLLLATDLIATFAVGLSMDAPQARLLGLATLALAILGVAYGWGRRRQENALWLLLPAWVLVPTLLIAVANIWRPAYMTARQMTLISAAYLLLVSAGIAWLWQRWPWAGTLSAVGLVAAMLYSSANYYQSPQFDKGDLSGMGDYVRAELRPGDLVLVEPSSWWRLFRYYLPLDQLRQGAGNGQGTDWHEVALPGTGPGALETLMPGWNSAHRRIWLARAAETSETSQWLQQHNCRIWDLGFESPISYLRLELFQSSAPIPDHLPAGDAIQHPFEAVFADQVRLLGYDLGQPVTPDSAIPITLYWQAVAPMDQRYKYKIGLVAASTGEQVAVTEREPFDGCWPTTHWVPGQAIVEKTGLHAPVAGPPGEYVMTIQMYDAETLDHLPVSQAAGIQDQPDGHTLVVPENLTWMPMPVNR
jgi:uncharacterized membrane protein